MKKPGWPCRIVSHELAALRVRRAILSLAEQHASLAPADFQMAYVAALRSVQNDLGYQGYAPVASSDTKNADANRAAYVQGQTEAASALL